VQGNACSGAWQSHEEGEAGREDMQRSSSSARGAQAWVMVVERRYANVSKCEKVQPGMVRDICCYSGGAMPNHEGR